MIFYSTNSDDPVLRKIDEMVKAVDDHLCNKIRQAHFLLLADKSPSRIRKLSAHMEKVKEWKRPQWKFIFEVTDNGYKGVDSVRNP